MPDSPLARGRKKALLEEKRVLEAGGLMERALPEMVRYLESKFYDESSDEDGHPAVSVKEKTGIFRAFAANIAVRGRIERSLGIGQRGGEANQNPLVVAIGGDIQVFKSLPPEKRRKLLLEIAEGRAQALPAPGGTDAAEEGEEPEGDLGEHP